MQARRRIDQVLEDGFASVEAIDIDELRARRQMAHDVENELSYYRRLLHGRMDLIKFEQRRRTGEEKRSLIEALPEILADDSTPGSSRGRHIATDLPALPEVGKRNIDHILGDDVLTRLTDIGDGDLAASLEAVQELEGRISEQRRAVQAVEDVLVDELAARYRTNAR
jgi:hypothetical protein